MKESEFKYTIVRLEDVANHWLQGYHVAKPDDPPIVERDWMLDPFKNVFVFKIVTEQADGTVGSNRKTIWTLQEVDNIVQHYGQGVIAGVPENHPPDFIVRTNLKWFVDPVKGVVLFEQFIPGNDG